MSFAALRFRNETDVRGPAEYLTISMSSMPAGTVLGYGKTAWPDDMPDVSLLIDVGKTSEGSNQRFG